MSSIVVFDCDGTLVDSQAAVKTAYLQAGIRPPADFWGRSWKDWLPSFCGGDMSRAANVHQNKNRIYLRLIEEGAVPLLSAGQAYLQLALWEARLIVVTAASTQAATAVMRYHGLEPFSMYCEISSDRNQLLEKLAHANAPHELVYVDDRARGDEPVRTIRYESTMTKDELMKDIDWTP